MFNICSNYQNNCLFFNFLITFHFHNIQIYVILIYYSLITHSQLILVHKQFLSVVKLYKFIQYIYQEIFIIIFSLLGFLIDLIIGLSLGSLLGLNLKPSTNQSKQLIQLLQLQRLFHFQPKAIQMQQLFCLY